ncbi:hypothetical protein C8Q74DRAFT_126045 [Fomes fomentarius]|nr:hypothetical protein C8Q74DRAFT_126045 [Fomes fomentarius]
MHALGSHKRQQKRNASAAPPEAPGEILILTLGIPKDDNEKDVVTLGEVLLEHVPHFYPFAKTLLAAGITHKPVAVRYLLGSPTMAISHAECRLRDIMQLPILQGLLNLAVLTSLQLELPLFSPHALPPLTAPSLTSLCLRGELPCTYQFIAALYAPALGTLTIHFHRNQWDRLDTLDDPMRDAAYATRLFPQSFPSLRTLRLEEREPRTRLSDVSLGCAIRPLMYIPTLEDVEVQMETSPLWVSDEDIAEIAVAWPDVRRLVLTCKNAANRCPSCTALRYIEAQCRELAELGLPKLRLDENLQDVEFNALQGDPRGGHGAWPSGLVGMDEEPHPLRMLRVSCQTSGTASKEQCMTLGWCLAMLFPNLETDPRFLSAASANLYTSDWYTVWMGVQSARAGLHYA